MKYAHHRSIVFNIGYHMVWSTKYRRPVLIGRVERGLKNLLPKIADRYNFQIKYLEVMPDHVHVFVSCHPKYAPSRLYKAMKGISGKLLFKYYPHLRRYLWAGKLWILSTFVETIGHISETTVKKYIEDQKS
jgi:putative transposase